MTVWTGTSGWQYRHWKDGFYGGVPARAWLSHYVTQFDTVELNGSFYRLPDRARFEAWAAAVPPGFVMAVKVSRYLTHVRRLQTPAEPVARFLEAATGLGDHLGPVLLQLPPNLTVDVEALEAVLRLFPADIRVAVEPRHSSWWVPSVRAVLSRYGAALVEADRRGRLGPSWQTASWRYLRFHEGRARPAPCYGRQALGTWAASVAASSGDTYAYFNNDWCECAIRDARTFARLVGRHGAVSTR